MTSIYRPFSQGFQTPSQPQSKQASMGGGPTNMSAYTPPSRAQSKPPQSQGTPYNPGGAYSMDGHWSPNVPIPSQAGGQSPPAPSYAPAGGNVQPGMRPEPFAAATYGPTGEQMDPSQAFAQRAAFVQSINDARAPFAEAVGNGYSGPPPQRDFGQMWSQAGDMVAGGWQNPLAPQQPGMPRGQQQDAVRNLFAQNNLQMPDGFMDQLIGVLGGQSPNQRLAPGQSQYQLPPVSQPSAYDQFVQDYNSGGPVGGSILEQRRRMGYGVPSEAQWSEWSDAGVRNSQMLQQQEGERSQKARQQWLDEETARAQAVRASQRQAQPALPAAYGGPQNRLQEAKRQQVLAGASRDMSLNGWQFKNMRPEDATAAQKKRMAELAAMSPEQIDRLHRQGQFANPYVPGVTSGKYRRR
jgi:hypothetical protein